MASLVGSIYNIVDQIFIGHGVGYLGNAATNVVYPFSTICLIQFFYCHRESGKRCFIGINKAGFFPNSAYFGTSVQVWNHGSIICGTYCRFFGVFTFCCFCEKRIKKTKNDITGRLVQIIESNDR